MNTFQLNKLSQLHNNRNIFFCKTDYLDKDFETISKKDEPAILISGNSDYPITDEIVSKAPKNIKKWFCQNAISNDPILEPIPLGLENELVSARQDHGIGYPERAIEKDYLIMHHKSIEAEKFIYANFNIDTNIEYRQNIKNIIDTIDYIDWQNPTLSLTDFFETLLSYKMILCPIGNGIDTHRLWEVLHLNRIPITIKIGNFKIYELYKKLPIIVLDSTDQLNDKNLLSTMYNDILNSSYDMSLLDTSYWFNSILTALNN